MWRWPSDMANCLCLTSNPLLKSSHLLMWKLCKRRYWTTANKIAAMIRRVWEEQQDCCIYRFYLLHSQGKAIYLHLIAERSIIENASNVCGSEAEQGQKMLKIKICSMMRMNVRRWGGEKCHKIKTFFSSAIQSGKISTKIFNFRETSEVIKL